MSVVVCGSRNWPAPWFVTAKMIELIPPGTLVITGGAYRKERDKHGQPLSVDQHAEWEARRLGYPIDVMCADWHPGGVHNPRAGLERNIAMLGRHPSAVLAF